MNILPEFEKFLKSQNTSISKSTLKNYKSDIGQFIAWYEKEFSRPFHTTKLSREVINHYFSSLTSDENNPKVTKSSPASIERKKSSLRKFALYAKTSGLTSEDLFEKSKRSEEPDEWFVPEFREHLVTEGISNLTIKNYSTDIKSFLNWVFSVVNETEVPENPLNTLSNNLVNDYAKRLHETYKLSPKSINRKLSSIRKYFDFLKSHDLAQISPVRHPNIPALETEHKVSKDIDINQIKEEIPQIPNKYSSFPPLRLLQRISFPYRIFEDTVLVFLFRKGDIAARRVEAFLSGKPILRPEASTIENLKKKFYAPMSVSLTDYPFHKRVLHHIRYTRPKWYHAYHKNPFVHYLHFAILVIYATAVGVALYQAFVDRTSEERPTFAAPAAPNRFLSFQGRLTDNLDTPITSATNIRFAIYNDETASGAALLWQEVSYGVGPDQDGIFSVILGESTPIDQSVFAENPNLWLGVTIEATPELTPRQRIATVAYAANADTLQGMPPTTQAGIITYSNVVLALNSSGNLSIGGSADHTFEVTGGTFTIQGQALALASTTGSAGDISLSPDGIGKVDIQKPIVNSSIFGNLVPGGVEINDKFGILATESAVASFVLNNDGSGDLFTASSSGTTMFTIENDGTLIGTNYTVDGGIIYTNGTGGTFTQTAAGNLNECLKSSGGGAPTWGTCGSGTSYWSLGAGEIHTINQTLDVLVGGTSTSSAKLALININSGTPTASISANSGNAATFLTGTGNLATTSKQTLRLGGTDGGDVLIAPSGENEDFFRFISDGTNLTLATTDNSNLLIDPAGTLQLQSSSNTIDASGNLTIAGDFTLTSGGTITGDGNVAITTTGAGNDIILNSIDQIIFSDFSNCTLKTTGTNLTCGIDNDTNYWVLNANGTLYPVNETLDLLIGGTTTSSANFAVTGINDNLPVATLSAGTTGALFLNSNGSIGTTSRQSITLGGANSGDLVFDSGTAAIVYTDFTTCNLETDSTGRLVCGTDDAGDNSAWVLDTTNGTLYPINETLDLILGGTSTSSANFAVIGINNDAPIATLSAISSGSGLSFNSNGTIQSFQNQTLTIGGNTTGIVRIPETLALEFGGRFLDQDGIRTLVQAENGVFDILNEAGNAWGTLKVGTIYGSGNASGNLTLESTTNSTKGNLIVAAQGGRVAIGHSSPQAKLDIRGLNGTEPAASISASSVYPALLVDNTQGDLIVASASGVTNFRVTNEGDVIVGNGGNGKLTAAIVDPYLVMNTGTIEPELTFRTTATGGNDGFVFETAGTNEIARFLENGNFGLGTNNPDSLLTLDDGSLGFSTGGGASDVSLSRGAANRLDLATGDTFNVVSGAIQIAGTTAIDSSRNASFATSLSLGGDILLSRTGANIAALASGDTLNIVGGGGSLQVGGVTVIDDSRNGSFNNITVTGNCSGCGGQWTLGSGVIYPNNETLDVLVGGSSTSAAKFAILNVNGTGPATATVSGNLIVMPTNGNGGSVGIGTTTPVANLDINGTSIYTADDAILDLSSFNRNTTYIKSSNNGIQGGAYLELGSRSNTYININTDDVASNALYINKVSRTGTNLVTVLDSGLVGIGTTTPTSELHVTRPLSMGATGKALAIFDQIESQDILAASASGTTRFRITNSGDLVLSNSSATTTFGGISYTWPTSGQSNGYALTTNGSGTLSWSSIGTPGDIFWVQGNGALFPKNSTVDLLVGGQSTSAAKFAITGVNNGTPVATLSASTNNNGLVLDAANSTIQSLRGNTLTLGGTATGLINVNNKSGSAFTTFDTVNSRVGIGTTEPTFQLTQSYSSFPSTFTNTSGDYAYMLRNGATNILGFAAETGTTNSIIMTNNGYGLSLGVNGTKVINIPGAGAANVGIGTTGPDQKLDILAGAGSTQLRLTSTDGSVYTDFKTNQEGDLNITPSGGEATVSGKLYVTNTGSAADNLDLTSQYGKLRFFGGWSDNYSYIESGNPSFSGNISGLKITGYNANDLTELVLQATTTNITNDASTAGSLVFRGTNKSIDVLNGSRLDFATSPGGDAGLTARMTLLNNGNFGVGGDTSPDALFSVGSTSQFQVNSSGAIAAATGLTSSGTITFSGFSTNGGLLYTNGSGVLTQLTSQGSLNDCLLSGGSGAAPSFGSCAGAAAGSIFWYQENGSLFPKNSTVDLLVGGQSTSSADFAVLNVNGTGPATATVSGNLIVMPTNGAGGRVGIGTTNPTQMLNVANTANAGILLQGDTDNDGSEIGTGFIQFSQDAGNVKAILGTVQSAGVDPLGGSYTNALTNTTLLGTQDAFSLQLGTNDTVRMTILDTGNVGIGTTGPDAPFDILSTGGTQLRLTYADGSTYTNLNTDTNGDLTIAPSGSDSNITGTLDVSGYAAIGDSASVGNHALNIVSTSTTNNAHGLNVSKTSSVNNVAHYAGAFTLTDTDTTGSTTAHKYATISTFTKSGSAATTGYQHGAGWFAANINAGSLSLLDNVASRVEVPSGATVTTLNNFVADRSYAGTAGTITTRSGLYVNNLEQAVGTQYGVNIADMTSGTNDYGLAIAGADTQALWIGSGADNTDAANGLAFGSSRDTNLYRSAANTLATDDVLSIGSNLILSNSTSTTTFGGIAYTWPTSGQSNGYALTTNGSGTLSWSSVATAANVYWTQENGSLFPKNSTVDLLVGGQSTSAAKFAVIGINNARGSQVATLSGDLVLDKAGSIQTTNGQTLTLGGASTGLINVDNKAGSAFTTFDTVNSRVGIGTTAPTYKLDLFGSGTDTYINVDPGSGSGNAGLRLVGRDSGTANPATIHANYLGGIVLTPEASDPTVTIGASSPVNGNTLSVSGKVAIGSTFLSTTAPTNGLLVEGNVGIGTTGPDQKLDVLSGGGGTQLRLTSTDGSVYTDFKTDQIGDFTITPSGGDASISGTLDVSGHAAFGSATSVQSTELISLVDNLNNTSGNLYGIQSFIAHAPSGASSATVYGLEGEAAMQGSQNLTGSLIGLGSQITHQGSGTISNVYGISVGNPGISGGGTITNNYGMLISDQTSGSSDYGLAIAGADTQALWIGSGADNTDAANGLAFGSSRDTNLYRSAANTLATDDVLSIGSNLILSNSTSTTTFGGIAYTWPTSGQSNGYALTTNGSGTLSWSSVATAANVYWTQENGSLFPKNSTVDLLIGGQTTTSAKFAILNVNGTGPATATVSGNLIVMPTNGAGGNMSVGTTTSSERLTVLGNIQSSNPGTTARDPFTATFSNVDTGAFKIKLSAAGTTETASLDLSYVTNTARITLNQNNSTTNGFINFLTNNAGAGLTEKMRLTGDGNVGMMTTAPDARLEINHATGDIMRMTYNDSDGSAANYTDFSLASDGDLTIDSSGNNISLGTSDLFTVPGVEGSNALSITAGDAVLSDGSLTITDDDNATSFSLTNNTASTANVATITSTGLSTGNALTVAGTTNTTVAAETNLGKFTYTANPGSSSSTGFTSLRGETITSAGSNIANNLTGVAGYSTNNSTSGTVNVARGVIGQITMNGSGGTIGTAYALSALDTQVLAGTITNAYGLFVGDQTGATNDYGIAIAGADTQALWVGSGADNIDAANGIAFGSSRDTNLYRSAANTLKTDDNLALNGRTSTGQALEVSGNAILTGYVKVDEANTGTQGLLFGSAGDTNLYRSTGNTLKTDDSFIVGTNLSVTGTSALTDNVTIAGGTGGTSGKGIYFPAEASDVSRIFGEYSGSNSKLVLYSADDAGTDAIVLRTNFWARGDKDQAMIRDTGVRIWDSINVGLLNGDSGVASVNYNRLGTNTTGHSLATSSALLVSGLLEVDDNTFLDSNLSVAGSTITFSAFTSCTLVTNGSGQLTCGGSNSNSNWILDTTTKTMYPINNTVDVLIGGTTTASAKFGVLNMNGNTPVASVSAQNAAGQALSLSGDGTIQTTRGNTLTLGGTSTGLINVNNKVGSAFTTFDTVNSRVGIGTSAPSTALDIVASGGNMLRLEGSSTYPRILFTSADGSVGAVINKDAGDALYFGESTDTGGYIFRGSGTTSIGVGSSATTMIIVGNGGSVGIGTTGPDQKLDVLAGGGSTQLRLTSTDGSVYTDFKTDQIGDLTITPSGGDATISAALRGTSTITAATAFRGPQGSSSAPVYSFTAHTNSGMYENAAGAILLAVTGTDKAVLDASGLILVDGQIRASDGNEFFKFTNAGSAVNELTLANAATGGIVTLAATGGDTDVAFSIDSKGADALNLNNNATGDINLGGGSGSTGCTVSNSTGNLTCTGTISGSGGVGYWNRTVGNVYPATTNDTLSATSAASTVATFTTNNPSGTLTNNTLINNTGAGTVTNLLNLTQSSGTVSNGLTFTGTFTNLINATNFTVTNGGNLTTAGTLAVNGDSITADGATLTINAAGNVDIQDALNADSITSDAGVSIAAGNSYTGSGAVTLSSGGAAGLTLDSASNTLTLAATDTTLTASGLATFTTSSSLSLGGATTLTFTSDNATINGSDAANGDLTLQGTSSSTRASSYIFLQPTAGFVGIGTDVAPDALLHVSLTNATIPALDAGTALLVSNSPIGAANANLSILSGTLGSSIINFGDQVDENPGFIQYDNNVNNMIFGTNAGSRLTLTSTGDLYITDGVSLFGTAVSTGTVEATKFCTGDGETNCVTDFSSLSGSGGAFDLNTTLGTTAQKNTTTDLLIGATTTASANFAFINNAGGTPTFRVGSDINLSRGAANRLDLADGDSLRIIGGQLQLDLDDTGSTQGIVFGSTSDVNLYRSGSNTMATDDKFFINNTNGLDIGAIGKQINFFTSGGGVDLSWTSGYDLNIGYSLGNGSDVIFGGGGSGLKIGINTLDPKYTLDVRGSSNHLPVASFSGTMTTIGPALAVSQATFSAQPNFRDLFVASVGAATMFQITNDGDVVVGQDGNGKITVLDIDPPYTIDGQKFATYLPSMPGVNEEVYGQANIIYDPSLGAYAYEIDLDEQEYGSDLWLFSRVIAQDLNLTSIILSPDSQARTWYKKDPNGRRIILYADRPTKVSYRFSAPRYDHENYSNFREDGPLGAVPPKAPDPNNPNDENIGDDPFLQNLVITYRNGVYVLVDAFGNTFNRFEAFSDLIVGNVQAGTIKAKNITTDSFNTTTSSITNLTTNTINAAGTITSQAVNSVGAAFQNVTASTVNITSNLIASAANITTAVFTNVQTGALIATNATVNTLSAGSAQVASLTTQTLDVTTDAITIGGQNFRDYIASVVDQILNTEYGIQNTGDFATNIISPLDENNLTVRLGTEGAGDSGSTASSKLVIEDNSGTEVASVDDKGNLALKGEIDALGAKLNNLETQTLSARDATISGTLTADRIAANSIEGLEGKIDSITSNKINAATLAANFYQDNTEETEDAPIEFDSLVNGPVNIDGYVNLSSISADFAIIQEGLLAFGPSQFGVVGVSEEIQIGSNLKLGVNSLDTLSGDLNIQPLKQGNIRFMAGLVSIDTTGNLHVGGDIYVDGSIIAQNALFKDAIIDNTFMTNLIAAKPSQNIRLRLSGRDENNPQFEPQLVIENASGSAVLAVNDKGDLVASGSGTFAKLNFNIVGEAYADISNELEATATGSAGIATIKAGRRELTIKNPNVTKDSLIYITPIGDTQNQVLYLIRQVPEQPAPNRGEGSFTVGIREELIEDIRFNWLIVN